MRVLAIGDVIGKPGRQVIRALLPDLVRREHIDLVVANAENCAGGIGTTPEVAEDLLDAGVAVVTGGNHTWKYREYLPFLDSHPNALRPLNYPASAAGRGLGLFRLADGRPYAVINLIGRTYMEPV